MKIPHSRPTVNEEDIYAVVANLRSGQIASGKETALFEKDMSDYIRMSGGVATNSGTNALHIALDALEIKLGDEVILPTYVCVSVLDAVNHTGATPVLADIESIGYNINPYSVEEKISEKTKAIIVPHMFGTPAKIEKLLEFNVPVIEDCAQSVGSEYYGKKVGSFGDLSAFSFYATKVMTTGQGGMVLTNSPDLLRRLIDLTEYDERENYCMAAHNFELTDFAAALGRNQLKRLDSFIKRRQEIAKSYDEVFDSINKTGRNSDNGICFRYVVEVGNPDKYIEMMKQYGVSCAKPVYMPLHRYVGNISEFPNAERATDRAISIPIYPSMTEDEVQYVSDAIKTVWSKKENDFLF